MNRLYKVTACALVCFLVLGAIRGLVPGLCSNLDIVENAECSNAAVIAEVRSCCQTTAAEPPSGETPPFPSEKPCPFCKIAKAIVQVPAFVTLPPPPEAVHTAPAFLPPAPPAVCISLPDERAPPLTL